LTDYSFPREKQWLLENAKVEDKGNNTDYVENAWALS
jgi:hypothetical protein